MEKNRMEKNNYNQGLLKTPCEAETAPGPNPDHSLSPLHECAPSPTRELTRAIMNQPQVNRRQESERRFRIDRREIPEQLAELASSIAQLRAHSHELSCWLTQVRLEYYSACDDFTAAQKELKQLLVRQAELQERIVKVPERVLRNPLNSAQEPNTQLSQAAIAELIQAADAGEITQMLELLQARLGGAG
jgi:hypothetical protein